MEDKSIKKSGTWLRKVYDRGLKRFKTDQLLKLLKDADDRLEEIRADRNQQRNWIAFTNENTAWNEIPDNSYIASRWWRRYVHPRKRAHIPRIADVPVPIPATLERAKQELRQRSIGQWNRSSGFFPPEGISGARLANAFEKGSFPIGKIVNTQTVEDSGIVYSSRCIDIQTGLTWLTVQAVLSDVLKEQVSLFLFLMFRFLTLNYISFRMKLTLNLLYGLMGLLVWLIQFLSLYFFLFGNRTTRKKQKKDGLTQFV